jgi:hypothetical protein
MGGWSLIGITCANMLVNIIVMMTLTIKDLCAKFKKYKHKFMNWLAKRRLARLKREAELRGETYLDGEFKPLNNDDVSFIKNTNIT